MKVIPATRKGRVIGGLVSGLVLIGAVGAAAAPPEDESAVVDTVATSLATEIPASAVATTVTTGVPVVEAPTTIADTSVPAAAPAPAEPAPAITVDSSVPAVAPAPADPAPAPAPAVTVARVVDGDTVEMSDGTTIRFIGIDTPEQGECGYDEATTRLSALVLDQPVTLTGGARDDIDRYGRLLRYVDLMDGTDVNQTMVAEGYAIARYDSRDGYGRHTREDGLFGSRFRVSAGGRLRSTDHSGAGPRPGPGARPGGPSPGSGLRPSECVVPELRRRARRRCCSDSRR